ncbi:unnamed protein product, partial [Mesorhabditis belari]|uniref:Uncharacterized protein n=1 Tax=Mesorhabditis belari TaxID=2138241 RepID=A0AAF3FHN0_9BILA
MGDNQQKRRHSTGDLGKFLVHPDREKAKRSITNTIQQLVVQIPVENLRRLQVEEGGSWGREAEHFCGITTMHGPLRAYRGKKMYKRLWQIMMVLSGCLLFYQVYSIVSTHLAQPVEAKVTFERSEGGLRFPLVTLCNYNPITQKYLENANGSGRFTDTLYKYLVQSNAELQAFLSTTNDSELQKMDQEYKYYKEKHPDYSVNDFFEHGGYDCSDMMKLCSFAGQKFNCCANVKETITSLGKCYTVDLRDSDEMDKQISPGEYNGLQIVLDSQLGQIYRGSGTESDPVFTNSFENGFRFYVHDREMMSFITSEGISVSPGSRVYSSIETEKFERLPSSDWGECVKGWPQKYKSLARLLPYSRKNCHALCRAQYFHGVCGCAPFLYNSIKVYPTCTPLELYSCLNSRRKHLYKALESVCKNCPPECENWEYHAYNSYGFNFSEGARKWLKEQNNEWDDHRIEKNFVMMSVFYRELAYTKFQEVKGSDLSTALSNIGGNMGLCYGMSVITCVEIIIFLYKMTWICISKSRRRYMLEKRRNDEEKERNLEETILEYKRHKEKIQSDRSAMGRLKKLSTRFRESSMKRKVADVSINEITDPSLHDVDTPPPRSPYKISSNKQMFMDNFYNEMTSGSGRARLSRRSRSEQPPNPELLELKIDLAEKDGGEKEIVGVIGERKISIQAPNRKTSNLTVQSPLKFKSKSILFDVEEENERKPSKNSLLNVQSPLQFKSRSIQLNEREIDDQMSPKLTSCLAVPGNLQKSKSVQFEDIKPDAPITEEAPSSRKASNLTVPPKFEKTQSFESEDLPVFTFDFIHGDTPQRE